MARTKPQSIAEAVALLRSSDTWDRRWGAEGLAAFSPPSESVVALLFEALNDSERDIRVEATNTLIALGKENPHVVRMLIRGLSHPSDMIRRWLVEAIARATFPDPTGLDAILGACSDPSWYVRYEVVNQLTRTKLEHPRLIAVLIQALERGESRGAEALAVQQNTEPHVLTALVAGLKNERINEASADALGKLGQATPEIVSGLFELACTSISNYSGVVSARQALKTLAAQGHVRGFLQKKLRSRVLPESTTVALILADLGVREIEVCRMLLVALEALDEEEQGVLLPKLEPWVTSVPEVALACTPLLHTSNDELRVSTAHLLVVLPEYQELAAETALAALSPTNLWAAHIAVQVLRKLPTLSEERQRRLLPHLISPPDDVQADPTSSATHHYDFMLRSPLIGLLLKTPNLLPEVTEALESLGEEPCFLRHKLKKVESTESGAPAL
jgi:HEAT repeats